MRKILRFQIDQQDGALWWITHAGHGLTRGSGSPYKMCFVIQILEESTSLRPFTPSPDLEVNYQPRIFKLIMQVMQCINSYLVKTFVKKQVHQCFLQLLILYHQITPSWLTCCPSCFSGLSILFPDTLLYLVKNSPRLNLRN